MNTIPLWVDIAVSALLLMSGMLSLVAALGLARLKDFFQRMHPMALANTGGTWCIVLGSIVYFSALEDRLTLHAWIIAILLSITAPVTTVLLARAALFRKRHAGESVPP
jgi:multicomponent K+:H+ antiporter subunit G